MVRPVEGSAIQKVGSLVEWYLMDRSVEVVFNKRKDAKGRLIPEFDVLYRMDHRLITERCLAMQIMSALMARNYRFTLPQIISGLTEQTWKYYVSNEPYPEWLEAESLKDSKPKRPRGRPRKLPRPVPESVPMHEPYAEPIDPGMAEADNSRLIG